MLTKIIYQQIHSQSVSKQFSFKISLRQCLISLSTLTWFVSKQFSFKISLRQCLISLSTLTWFGPPRGLSFPLWLLTFSSGAVHHAHEPYIDACWSRGILFLDHVNTSMSISWKMITGKYMRTIITLVDVSQRLLIM